MRSLDGSRFKTSNVKCKVDKELWTRWQMVRVNSRDVIELSLHPPCIYRSQLAGLYSDSSFSKSPTCHHKLDHEMKFQSFRLEKRLTNEDLSSNGLRFVLSIVSERRVEFRSPYQWHSSIISYNVADKEIPLFRFICVNSFSLPQKPPNRNCGKYFYDISAIVSPPAKFSIKTFPHSTQLVSE